MADAKRKFEKVYITGTLVYPHINKVDDGKYGKGFYNCNVRVSRADVSALLANLDAMIAAKQAEVRADISEKILTAKGPKLASLKKQLTDIKVYLPFKDEVGEDGEPNGNIIFKSEMSPTKKDGTKRKPVIVNAAGVELKNPPLVYGGTLARVCVALGSYYVEGNGALGVKMYLSGVQILKLVSSNSGSTFGAVEGYDAIADGDDTETTTATEKTSGSDEDADDAAAF